MSAFGPKRTFQIALHMSAFGSKADTGRYICKCMLTAQSGHLNGNKQRKSAIGDHPLL